MKGSKTNCSRVVDRRHRVLGRQDAYCTSHVTLLQLGRRSLGCLSIIVHCHSSDLSHIHLIYPDAGINVTIIGPYLTIDECCQIPTFTTASWLSEARGRKPEQSLPRNNIVGILDDIA
jgi:hypothetical protein